jgi:hypothetical protein
MTINKIMYNNQKEQEASDDEYLMDHQYEKDKLTDDILKS